MTWVSQLDTHMWEFESDASDAKKKKKDNSGNFFSSPSLSPVIAGATR